MIVVASFLLLLYSKPDGLHFTLALFSKERSIVTPALVSARWILSLSVWGEERGSLKQVFFKSKDPLQWGDPPNSGHLKALLF